VRRLLNVAFSAAAAAATTCIPMPLLITKQLGRAWGAQFQCFSVLKLIPLMHL
jgi:hypothetical protein